MDTTPFFVKPETSAERKDLYERLGKKSAAPLWEVLGEIVTPEPRPACVPAMWRYHEIRPLLMEAGRVITAQEAERRVLVLENPGMRGASRITQSLYAGVQLVLPGETAPSHRHSASALRLVIESGDGAYTAVDGERAAMRPGDFILTPSWTYHDHGNQSDSPAVWLDGLDIPIVNLFDASFAEHHPEEIQPVTKKVGDAPVVAYPYARSRETLEKRRRNGPLDSRHGLKMQYVNPATGGDLLPTIAAFLQLLPPGFRGGPYRSTDATIYCVVEGRGRSHVGSSVFEWGPHDIFVVPSWRSVSHEAQDDAVLFSFSDRPVQKALGLWREESLSA